MKALILGTYDRNSYTRGNVIIEGLKKNNLNVEVFIENDWLKYPRVVMRLLRRNYDFIIVHGIFALFLSKLFSRKPVIFDVLVPAYDTLILDRKRVKQNSILAKLVFLADKYSCKFSDRILMINKAYLDYFVEKFGVDRKKCHVLYLGADERIFKPAEKSKETDDSFVVEFHGSFIPLHGVETIVDSAEILGKKNSGIKFVLIGEGQMFESIKKRIKEKGLDNISLTGWIKYENLPEYITEADVCLGIFGTTDKARRCITHKVFEIMAMKKPLITMRSSATEELFKNEHNAILVKGGDAKALSEAILMLTDNPDLRHKIGENANRLYLKEFTAEGIGRKLMGVIKGV